MAITDAILRIGRMCEKLQANQHMQDHQNSTGPSSIKAPEPFSGQGKDNINTWIFQVESYFALKKITNLERLNYIPSMLSGHALVWFQGVCTSIDSNARPYFSTWQSFVDELRQQFQPPNLQQMLRRQLRQLTQRGNISQYIGEFRTVLSQILRMEEEDKIAYFIEGLSANARNELFYRNPNTLDDAISISISYFSSNYNASLAPRPNFSRNTSNTSPMEIGNMTKQPTKHYTPPKKCDLHGNGNHSTTECRVLKSRQGSSEAPRAKSVPFKSRLNTLAAETATGLSENTLPSVTSTLNTMMNQHLDTVNGGKADLLTLRGTIQGVPALFLIDSGASHDYISSKFVHENGIKPTSRVITTTVALADGTKVSANEVTKNLNIKIQNFFDSVKFYVFPIAGYDAILGKPWLYRHNPDINWREQIVEIHFDNNSVVLRKDSLSPLTPPMLEDPSAVLLNARQARKSKEIFAVTVVSEDKNPTTVVYPEPIQKLIESFKSVFPEELTELPPERAIEHTIETVEGNPVVKPTYRMSPKELSELKRQIDSLLSQGFIQASSSPWAAPALFARKKDGTLRLCTDYRGLNSVTIKNRYPIPRIDEILDSLQGSEIFSKIDLRQGYYQIRIRESDVPKTAFRTHFGHFEYRVMPFGLSNAPATFMQLMHSIFHDLLNKYVTIYLDDILIFSKSLNDHYNHLHEVLKRLKENRLYAKMSKCHFCVDQIEFLGHVISKDGISVDPQKVRAITEIKRPTKLSELQSFLGLVGYYRRFIANFSSIAQPLTNLTKKDTPFCWLHQQETAFEALKAKVTTAPVLKLPDFSKPFVVTTDASAVAVAGVLSQEYADGLHPICFESHKLNAAEGNYPTHELEAYAIVYCFKQWRCYLEGTPTIVQTDHAALKFLKTQKNLSRRLTRWVEFLQQFEFEICYKPGKENIAADALSRLLILDSTWPEYLYEYIELGNLPSSLSMEDKEMIIKESVKFCLDNETLYYLLNGSKVPYVPFCFRADLIANHHRSLGHISGTELHELLRDRYYWPTIKQDINKWVAACANCQLASRSRENMPTEDLHPLNPLPAFHRWGLDFIGPLPASKNGNKYILVAIDHTTKWPIAKPVKNCNAETVASFLKDELFANFGCPTEIISDRGAAFRDASLKLYLEKIKIQHNLTSAYHPRSNGVTERFNGLLGKMISKYVAREPRANWENYLDQSLLACRIRSHRATGFSPFYLVYGQKPNIPGDELLPSMAELDELELVNPRLKLIEELREKRGHATNNLRSQKETMITQYKKKLKHSARQQIKEGSAVLIRNEARKKLEPTWLGPLIVTAALPNGLFELQTIKGERYGSRVHRDRLKLAIVNSDRLQTWKNPKRFDQRQIIRGGM